MKLTVALTVAALMTSTAALAQSEPQTTAQPPSTASPNTYTETAPAPPAGPAATDQASTQLSSIFDQLNASHTGKMTREEAQAHPTVASNFDKADANKDGVLTKDEFLAAFKANQ
jgi:hypothetical protein